MTGVPVRLEGITRIHQSERAATEAIRGLSLSAKPGEFVAIVGPSGCGKSTILNLVAGLDRPTEGRVEVAGREITGAGADRIMVFQEHALFPWLDVLGNVEFGLRVAGIPPAERRERAVRYLQMVQLEKFLHHRPHELSGGMRQRVALARALVVQPKVLLMDEPFAALDAQTRDDLQRKLQDLFVSERPTTLFVTHNVREAACLGDRVVVLSHRPAHVKAEFTVDLPRPREIEDPKVIEVARRIKEVLEDEIAWSRASEFQGAA